MVYEGSRMHTLSKEESQTLIAIVRDSQGSDLIYEKFADAMLGLFEDISGFETISPEAANRVVLNLWRNYYDQKAHRDN